MRILHILLAALTIVSSARLDAAVGISPFFPADTAPRDVVGLRYSTRIDNLSAGENVVLAFGHMRFCGLESKTHFIEVNAYNYWVEYKDMGSAPWPPSRNGSTRHNQGALWVSVSDYNKEGFVGIRPVDKATLLLFPRMNSGIDNIPGLTKIENISQQNMVGKDIHIEVTRGSVERWISAQPNWGGRYRLENGKQVSAEMLPPGTYRLWNVKAVFDGVEYAWVVAHPAAQSRYFAPYQLIHFVTEFFNLQKSQMRLHVWNPQFLREGGQEWEDLAKWQFHHLPGPDPFGPRVVEVEGRHVIELSNDKEINAYTLKKNDTFNLEMNPTVQWQSEHSSPVQGQHAVRVTAVLSRAVRQPVKLVVRAAGTAMRGTDYKLDETTSLSIPPGKTTAELQIPLGKAALGRDRRSIRLTFVSASPAAVAGRVTHVVNLGSKSEELPVDPAKEEAAVLTPPLPASTLEASKGAVIRVSTADAIKVLKLKPGQPRLYDSTPLREIEKVDPKLSTFEFTAIPQRLINSYEIIVDQPGVIYAFGAFKNNMDPEKFLGKDASRWQAADGMIQGKNIWACFQRTVVAGEVISLSSFELQIAAGSIRRITK